jgi:hypothetical protein
MRLAPAQPDQELLDALLLDAAWEQASRLELELKQVRVITRQNHDNFTRELRRRLKLETAIGGLMTSLKGSPDRPVDSIVDELNRILNEDK